MPPSTKGAGGKAKGRLTKGISSEQIQNVLKEFEPKKASLVIPILQAIQEKFGYVPPEPLSLISQHTKVARSNIYGVVTFYEEFRNRSSAKYRIRTCGGIPCQQNPRYSKIMSKIKSSIKNNHKFVLEPMACPGLCYQSPMMIINNDYYVNLTESKVVRILKRYK